MLEKTSLEFRKLFLLEFTKELVRNSSPELFIEQTLREEKKEIKEQVKEEIKRIEKPVLKKEELVIPKIRRKELRTPILRIPEPMLPQRLQYLKPTPTKREIELGKLNPLIKDPMVVSIQCNGADENIVVSGKMGTKKTGIILNKQEIDEVIQKFSKIAKIPVQEGVTKIVAGKLILSAIVSNVVSPKFVIKKMRYSQHPIFK